MAMIQRKDKKGQATYLVRVRDVHGRWYPAQSFDRKVDAQAHERALLTQRDQGADSQIDRDLTVASYYERWSRECRGQVSVGWKITQDQMARDYALPHLAHRILSEVRPHDIGWALERVAQTGLSPQTVKHVYSLLHKIFEDAVEHYGILARNPVLRRYRPRVPLRERNFLSPAQSWKLLDHVRSHYLGPAIWLQTLAGLRPSEVQALTWGAVDFDREQILIRASFNNKEDRIQAHPKQDDWGTAPIPPALRRFLWERRGEESEFVAQSSKCSMLPYETYLRALKSVCLEAGVPHVTPHELRHSCTEIYVQAGASAEDIRRLLNQSSLSATARYMHRTDERLLGIAAKVGMV